jgi:hypothetical protein
LNVLGIYLAMISMELIGVRPTTGMEEIKPRSISALTSAIRSHAEHDCSSAEWAGVVLVVVLLGSASIGIFAIRRPILRAAGWALVVNEHIEPADVIVVSIDADGAGALEAADLIHSGVATRVAIFTGSPDAVGDEFVRRGVPYEGEVARSIRQLRSLGVETIDQIPGPVIGTEDEGPVLADWCNRQGFRSVIVVSTSDHSRRLRRVLHRSLKGHQTRVMVHPTSARYPHFDPDRWWESRGGVRVEIEELEKLLLDVLRHPIS